MIIDMHSHFFPEHIPDLEKQFGEPNWPWIKHVEPGKAMLMYGKQEFRPVYSACWDVDVRIGEMDRDGIDLNLYFDWGIKWQFCHTNCSSSMFTIYLTK